MTASLQSYYRKKVLEDDVVSVLPFDHQLLLVSARSGCFIYDEVRKKLSVWNTPANEILKEGIANRGSHDERFYFYCGYDF